MDIGQDPLQVQETMDDFEQEVVAPEEAPVAPEEAPEEAPEDGLVKGKQGHFSLFFSLVSFLVSKVSFWSFSFFSSFWSH